MGAWGRRRISFFLWRCHIGRYLCCVRASYARVLVVLLQVCAYNMPPVELEGLRETFESIDKSHSGTISLEELTSHLQVDTCDRKT